MKHAIALIVAVFCAVSLWGGCVTVGTKGGDAEEARGGSDRVRYSPEWTYRSSYAAWQVNHRTIEEQLEQASFARNNRLINSAAQDAAWALRSMKANLPEGKAKQLDPIISEYQAVGAKAMQKVNSAALLSRLRTLSRAVASEFAPGVVPIVAPRDE